MNQAVRPTSRSSLAGPDQPRLLQDERLHEVLTATALRTPSATALRCGNGCITYAALDDRSDRWAAALRLRGIGPGQVVGVWLDRSIALHVAVLAVLKAGATYLPFDAAAPPDRIAVCLQDSSAALLLTSATDCSVIGTPILDVERLNDPAPDGPILRPPAEQPAYIIYTSGSSGQPKGVAVSHRSICHLIRAENEVLRLTSDDVVHQGFSSAFDMMLEEVFISYLVGATIAIATAAELQQTDALPALLEARGVTVLHCVPTMLAMLESDVPGLRLINVGGEACPEALVLRWSRPGRRMVNTYGPTEATVTATAAELRPGAAVTIGRPLPNYTVVLLDEAGNVVPEGEPGELCIGGPGVSLGYINRPELTADRFIPVPATYTLEFPLAYRTGDLATLDAAGNLLLHGRLDSQVKHRGFRIELGEIEAELCRLPGVRAAAVALRGEGAGEHLAAYVVRDVAITPPSALHPAGDARAMRGALSSRLPCYMVPATLHVMARLPCLPSGKIDRKALRHSPVPLGRPGEGPRVEQEGTDAQQDLLAAFGTIFPQSEIGVDDDFFRDLGGHSLFAAMLVSTLRRQDRFAGLSLQHLYALRTVGALANRFPPRLEAAPATAEPVRADDRIRHAVCSAAQLVALVPVLGLASLEFLFPYLAFDVANDRFGLWHGVAAALIAFVAIPPLLMLLAVGAKWALLGRVRPGRHRLWGVMYFRWWLVERLIGLVNTGVLADTPLMAAFHRAMGARIGRGVHFGSIEVGAHDLLEVGAATSLGSGVIIDNARVEAGWLEFGRVVIGDDAYVGSNCVLSGGSTIGTRGELGNLSMLAQGAAVPQDEAWAGSPAAFRSPAEMAEPQAAPGRLRTVLSCTAFATIAALLLPILHLLPMIPALYVIERLQDLAVNRYNLLLIAPLVALGYTALVVAEVVSLRWAVLGRVREGVHATASLFYLRKWTVDRMMELSLSVLHPVYASLYVTPFFRALGTKVGPGAEISTASSVTNDLLEIGAGAFVADSVTLGDPEIRRGRITLRRTLVGNRAFIGNCAVLPDGTHVPDGCLVGCLSVPPDAPLKPGQACFGSPSLIMPSRQQSTVYDARLTYHPGRRQIIERLSIEGARILLPRAAVVASLCLALDLFQGLPDQLGLAGSLLAVPMLFVSLFCLPALLGTAALKWALVGRYRAAEHPMWSRPVWLTEAVTAVYEALPVQILLRHLHGTPFLAMALRLFGARIGRRVWLDTTDLTEFDLVTIGDCAELARHSGPQTHLFEDRVMKAGPVTLGTRSTLGAGSICLPGARLEDGARLGALSLVMKGETIPVGPAWAGSPACRQI